MVCGFQNLRESRVSGSHEKEWEWGSVLGLRQSTEEWVTRRTHDSTGRLSGTTVPNLDFHPIDSSRGHLPSNLL